MVESRTRICHFRNMCGLYFMISLGICVDVDSSSIAIIRWGETDVSGRRRLLGSSVAVQSETRLPQSTTASEAQSRAAALQSAAGSGALQVAALIYSSQSDLLCVILGMHRSRTSQAQCVR